jgi:methionyl-tRNA formyltransferase
VLNILYAGSPAPSAAVLEYLIIESKKAGAVFRIAGVLTNPSAPQGRSKVPEPTPVARAAENARIPCVSMEKLDAGCRDTVAALEPDLLVCFAFGKIFGPKFLALFPLGGINLHPSLLPKYRGAAPVPAVILNRDSVTGVSVQKIAAEMDSGDILAQKEIPLTGTETASGLLDFAAMEGAKLLAEVIYETSVRRALPAGIPQNHAEASFCAQLRREDGKIDWAKSAEEIDAQIRAFYPWPGSFTEANGENIKILRAAIFRSPRAEENLPAAGVVNSAGTVIGIDKDAGILVQTGKGILAVLVLQRQAKKEVNWKDFVNGYRNFIGVKLI